ncbi:MAG: NAD-dependent epimerase/dehydratase family protein [Candidatus Omnitrophota bacterium]
MGTLKNKRICLVGGAGFIGHHLAIALTQLGATVEIIDSLQVNNILSFAYGKAQGEDRDLYSAMVNQRFDLLRQHKIPIEVQDARDYHAFSRIIDEIKPNVLVHLAAVAHAGRSNKDPMTTFDHSLRTLENALDSVRGIVEHFIYFSSSMVYGHFEGGEVNEETVCNPLGIYGALKYSGEKIVIAYNQVFGLPYTIVRPSALYGERCISRRVGQIFIENTLRGKSVKINGDGNDALDFTYVGDLVQAIIKIIENEKSKGEIFNVTYGRARSIKEMSEILRREIPDVKIEYLPKDKLMPDRGTLCVDKAKSILGYSPQFPLEKGFVKYINWYKSLGEVTGWKGELKPVLP